MLRFNLETLDQRRTWGEPATSGPAADLSRNILGRTSTGKSDETPLYYKLLSGATQRSAPIPSAAVQCTALHCTALLQCTALQCTDALQCTEGQCSAMKCSALKCNAVQCSAVQCVVCCFRRRHQYLYSTTAAGLMHCLLHFTVHTPRHFTTAHYTIYTTHLTAL